MLLFVSILVLGGAKFPKMEDSLPRTPMNRRAKFDSAGFIIGGEIRIRKYTQNYKK